MELSPSQTSINGSWGTLCRVPESPGLEFASPLGLHSFPGVTWAASGGPSFVYSGLLWGSGKCFQAVASFGHPARKGLCMRQGTLLAELWEMHWAGEWKPRV